MIHIPKAVPDDVLDILIRCADANTDKQRVLMELECYRRYYGNTSDADVAERRLVLAIQEADKRFEAAGATGTKNYVREFLVGCLSRHGLELRAHDKPAGETNCSQQEK